MLPGIIAAVIADKLVVHSKWPSFKFSLYALVLGMLSYSALQAVYYAWDILSTFSFSPSRWSHLNTWSAIIDDQPQIYPPELLSATVLSIGVAFLVTFIVNYKVFNKIAQRLNISFKYGDENLFSYYLNAKDLDWICVRDIENDLSYQGRIVSYSETETDTVQELVMAEVTVYRYSDSAELYWIPTIYLSKLMGKFVIEEVPPFNTKGDNGNV